MRRAWRAFLPCLNSDLSYPLLAQKARQRVCQVNAMVGRRPGTAGGGWRSSATNPRLPQCAELTLSQSQLPESFKNLASYLLSRQPPERNTRG